MKNTILLFIILFTFQFGFCQVLEINSETGKLESTSIIAVDSVSKEELFSKVLSWIALNYRSANDVIQLQDKENGQIIAKAIFAPLSGGMAFMSAGARHTLIFDIKDSKVRMTYTNLIYTTNGSDYKSFDEKFAGKGKIVSLTETRIQQSIQNFTDFIRKKSVKKSDW